MPERGKSSVFVPAALLESVVAYFQPRRVILFGSQAREAGEESDIDLLIELDDDVPSERLSAKAMEAARGGYRGAVDIIPCRRAVLESRARAIGSFAHTVLRDG